ncbi:hypothetical protein MWU97_002808 [Clostridioides difficile]|nr:hypothetical protein [Clostridioides difficile]
MLELLKEIEDDAEIDSLLQSTDLFKSASDKKLTIEEFREILYLIFDYPHKHYTFKYFEV